MSEDTLYWILSTLPQVLGAMTALIMAGISFFFENLNEEVEQEESKETVIYEIKKLIFHRTILLLALSIVAIITDIVFIGLTPWVADKIQAIHYISWINLVEVICFWILVVGLNLYAFIIIVQLLKRILNPDFYVEINNSLALREKIELPVADSVPPQDFIDLFRKFEQVVRSFFPDTKPFKGGALRALVLQLINEGVLEKKDLDSIQNIINKRNIYIHGGDIGRVGKPLMEELAQYIAYLEKKRVGYIQQRSQSRMEDAFRIWIDKYVENISDAIELERAIRAERNYGKFKVSKDGELLIVYFENARAIYLHNEKAKNLFLKILIEKYSFDQGDSIANPQS